MRPLIIMHGENIDWCHTVIRMLMYLVGVAVLALGMSLQTASGLGVAALTCFATTLSMLTGKTLGFWITATYVAYIVAQLAILRSEFQPRILLELFFSTLIGGLTDLFMAVNPLHPTALPNTDCDHAALPRCHRIWRKSRRQHGRCPQRARRLGASHCRKA